MTDESGEGPTSVWTRWTDDGSVSFHDYCAVLPWDWKETAPNDEPEIEYCGTPTRQALRLTPLLVALAIISFVIISSLRPRVVGPSDIYHHYVPVFETAASTVVVVSIGGLAWAALLVGILRAIGLVKLPVLSKGTFVYGLMTLLLFGSVLSVYVVNTGGELNPHTTEYWRGNVLFTSGFLLLLSLGGYLVYDGMLRTENMFWNLHKRRPPVIENGEGYEDFRRCFEKALEFRPAIPLPERVVGNTHYESPVRAAELFSAIFLLPFLAFGLIGEQVQPVISLIMGVFDFFLVVVFFQFLILIKFFNRLLRNYGPTTNSGGFKLKYEPFHPDGYAGFRDFGRFSTRVNSLLVIGGLYLVYRLYIHGIRTAPEATAEPIKHISWGVSYLGPLVGYVIAVILWLYFSFWQIHKAMRGGREAAVKEIRDEDDENLEEYNLKNEAPVWPINVRIFLSLVSMDLVPILGAALVLGGAR